MHVQRMQAPFDQDHDSHAETLAQGDEGALDVIQPQAIKQKPNIARQSIDEDAIKVIKRLTRHGYRAYLVGGSVRDLLLGRKPKDFDIATDAYPPDVRRIFRNCRLVGRRFRLAHILFSQGKIIEVATFRQDPLTMMRQPPGDTNGTSLGSQRHVDDQDTDLLIRNDNVFGEPHEDALRRDFTINGLFYDLDRDEVIDYVGGLGDLERFSVRTIGHPDVRIREDPVRMLRAIKFAARLDFGIDPELMDALVAQRRELHRASPPRVFEEILRLLRGGAAHRSIYLTWSTGLLAEVLPQLAAYLDDHCHGVNATWRYLQAIDRHHAERSRLVADAVLLLALLWAPLREFLDGEDSPAHAFEEWMGDVLSHLAIPKRLKERMRLIALSQPRLRNGRVGKLNQRDFYPEALQFLHLDCLSRGEALPAVLTDANRRRRSARSRRRSA